VTGDRFGIIRAVSQSELFTTQISASSQPCPSLFRYDTSSMCYDNGYL